MQNLRNYFGVYAVMNTNLTSFFIGNNMSQTLTAFGVNSNNLLYNANCSYISSKVNSIFSSYCPISNNISMLFYEASLWSLITLFFIFLLSVLMYSLDLVFRAYRLNKFYKRIGDNAEFYDQKSSAKNKLNLSEHTLRNDE